MKLPDTPLLATKPRIALVIVALLIGVLAGIGVWFRISHRGQDTTYGVSFSPKYARELGLDWRDTYRQLLTDFDFTTVRLMSYWDTYEPSRDQYDFTDLDWQLHQAAARGKQVTLAIGLRQPRWPECHQPAWTQQLTKSEFDQELTEYVGRVVARYRHHPALASYQLENEVANRSFGDCPDFDRNRLQAEFDLVKYLDPHHPLITNVSNQSGIPVREPIGDKVGFSMYQHAAFESLGTQWQWSFWYIPSLWHSVRAQLVEWRGAETFVHELQAEPWGTRPTPQLSRQEQDELMSPQQLKRNIEFARSSGLHEIHLWGVEWWYWRSAEYGDDSLLRAAQDYTTP